jgi:RNA polymerase sigma-70 factor (ECF subfamily)
MSNNSLLYQLYLTSRKSISRVVARLVPPHAIEDIVQETYVRICQTEHQQLHAPKAFMFTIARNLALDYRKQAAVQKVDQIGDEEMFDVLSGQGQQARDEVFQQAASEQDFALLCEAVRQLPQQCRKVFVLKKVYGYSQQEIAVQLNISESTVEKHIAAGMKSCMLYMRKANAGEAGPGQTPTHRHFRGGSYE